MKQEHWSGRTAFILASIGAAVGLGNIWKFPYTVGSSGGSAFVLIYVGAILLVATPIMIAEMILGRSARCSAPTALAMHAKKSGASRHWSALGWMGVLAFFLVLSFYSVIAGWTVSYLIKTSSGSMVGLPAAEVAGGFGTFMHNPMEMAFWHMVFMAGTVYVVSRGVKTGLEKVAKIVMPALFFTLVALVINSAIVGDFSRTVEFLFSADLSKIAPAVVLAAVGQAFFSLNVGVGGVLTYSAYLPANVSLYRSAIIIALGDTLVALLAGLAIFPIVFANGLDPAGGPGLIFVTLSTAFAQMPGGAFIGSAFFVMILLAAVTSSISMLEAITARAIEFPNVTRKRAAPIIGLGAFLLGLVTVFSFNVWEDVHLLQGIPTLAEKTPFELIDYVVVNVMMPLGGMLYALFAGWWLSKETSVQELGLGEGRIYQLWLFLVRFVAPLAVAAVFFYNLA